MALCCRDVLLVLCFVLLISVGTKADDIDDDVCTYVNALDADGDLWLSYADFAIIYGRIQTCGCVSPEGQLELLKKILEFFPLVDRNLKAYIYKGPVSLKEVILNMRGRRGEPDLVGAIADLVRFVHTLFQCEGSDRLTLTYREFKAMYISLGIQESVDSSFEALDDNGDKKISFFECYYPALKFFNAINVANDDKSIQWIGQHRTCLEVAKNNQALLPPGA